MKSLLTATALAALVSLSACSPSVSSKDGGTAPNASTGFLGSKADDLSVDTAAAFKGLEEVVIGEFKIGFVDSKAEKAKAGGGLMGNGMGGRSKAKLQLTGVSDELKQQITDAAYKDLVAQLKAKGYKVADREAFAKSEELGKVKTYDAPYAEDGIEYYIPTQHGKKMFIFMGDIPGTMGGFAFDNPSMGATKYATRNGQKVLNVVYVLDFANADSYGGRFTSTSAVNVGQGLSVRPGGKLALIGGEGGTFSTANGTITLGQPVYSTKEFGKVQETTTEGEKSMEMAVNVATTLLGAGSNISRDYEVKADPAQYKSVSGEVLKDANGLLVGKMGGLK